MGQAGASPPQEPGTAAAGQPRTGRPPPPRGSHQAPPPPPPLPPGLGRAQQPQQRPVAISRLPTCCTARRTRMLAGEGRREPSGLPDVATAQAHRRGGASDRSVRGSAQDRRGRLRGRLRGARGPRPRGAPSHGGGKRGESREKGASALRSWPAPGESPPLPGLEGGPGRRKPEPPGEVSPGKRGRAERRRVLAGRCSSCRHRLPPAKLPEGFPVKGRPRLPVGEPLGLTLDPASFSWTEAGAPGHG